MPIISRSRQKEHISRIKNSKFFDNNWYLNQNQDVKAEGIDPALHYLKHGAFENRDPSRIFSTLDYKRKFPEINDTGENPLVHFSKCEEKDSPRISVHDRFVNNNSRLVEKIPKIFHSIWLSGEEVPSPLQLGVDSFSQLHPEYEIRRWTQDNFKDDNTAFLQQALRERKWAFAADYIRLKVLYEFGGIYADGDVSFYKRLDDYLVYDSVMCWENYFALGPHFIMAKPKSELIGHLLDIYKNRNFYRDEALDVTPIPVIATWELTTKYGLCLDGSSQLLNGCNLIESENVFTTNFEDTKCICEHLYFGGWTEENSGSYKDGLRNTAERWKQIYESPRERRLRALSTSQMRWSYYFIKNAPIAFPAIAETPNMNSFDRFRQKFLSGLFVSNKSILKSINESSPLNIVSRWHLKPRSSDKLGQQKTTASPITANPDIVSIVSRNTNKVSIVIPIYNVENYLVKCLKSVQAQTHPQIEVLLIDDGSTDGSSFIAKTMAEVDARFTYYRKTNGGLGDARNFAIEYLNSDLVTFVDSDDFISADHIERLEAKFRQGHDLAICNMALTKPDGRITELRDLGTFWGEEDPVIHALLSSYECYAWNKMYPTEKFTKNVNARFSDGWFEDFALIPALVAGSKSIGFVNERTYNYVQRPSSILANARKNIERNIEIFDSYNLLQRHKDFIPNNYWSIYHEWMAPKHYFTWRVSSILNEKSHGRRVAAATQFSQRLNAEIPNWSSTSYFERFIMEPAEVQKRIEREALVKAFRYNDASHFARMGGLT